MSKTITNTAKPPSYAISVDFQFRVCKVHIIASDDTYFGFTRTKQCHFSGNTLIINLAPMFWVRPGENPGSWIARNRFADYHFKEFEGCRVDQKRSNVNRTVIISANGDEVILSNEEPDHAVVIKLETEWK